MSEVAAFYDDFTSRQVGAGINNRHLSIRFHLEKAGLKKGHKVLEVGCGIGTVSQLILRALSGQGSLFAVDISAKSISLARQFNQDYKNARFEICDLTKETIGEQFDVIVMPDVIEHIPFELYPSLFANIYGLLRDEGFVFIHIPHPNYLEWLVANNSEELQIIDNPVYTDKLLSVVYPVGFYLHRLTSYSVYTQSDDYQIVILKKKAGGSDYSKRKHFFRPPLPKRLLDKIGYLLRGNK